MSTTPDSVQPDPRDIRPDGFAARLADADDTEGHLGAAADSQPEGFRAAFADGPSGPEGLRSLADGDDDVEGHVYKP